MKLGARPVRLRRIGSNQVVDIPRGLELPGDEAVICRDGPRLIIEPARRRSLRQLLDTWHPIDTDWPVIQDPPPEPPDLTR